MESKESVRIETRPVSPVARISRALNASRELEVVVSVSRFTTRKEDAGTGLSLRGCRILSQYFQRGLRSVPSKPLFNPPVVSNVLLSIFPGLKVLGLVLVSFSSVLQKLTISAVTCKTPTACTLWRDLRQPPQSQVTESLMLIGPS